MARLSSTKAFVSVSSFAAALAAAKPPANAKNRARFRIVTSNPAGLEASSVTAPAETMMCIKTALVFLKSRLVWPNQWQNSSELAI
jgi:hypothetical protein